jgi:hypothetical protein
MIKPFLGTLAEGQALTDADEISENVMQIAAVDYAGPTDVWLTIDTAVAAATAGTMVFDLVLATSAALSTAISVVQISIAAITDKRVAVAGRHITAINVGKVLKDMLDTDGSDYPFIGLKNTLSTGTTVSINASLSNSEPQTEYHRQVTESNVGVPGTP